MQKFIHLAAESLSINIAGGNNLLRYLYAIDLKITQPASKLSQQGGGDGRQKEENSEPHDKLAACFNV